MDELKDVDRYIDEWTRTQILIWREKIERLKIVRSGRLHQSISASILKTEFGATIEMKFLKYGIYQALGTGNGYTPGNGGDLQILDREYRETHGLNKPRQAGPMPGYSKYMTSGKPRERRDWFSKKLYMSTMAMIEDLAIITADLSARVICDVLEDPRRTIA